MPSTFLLTILGTFAFAPMQDRDTGNLFRPVDSTTKLPLRYTRSAKFTTDEGTWMSVDVSPDGRTLVFDLVGDLYTIPIQGGKATRITSGPGFDYQPRFSPDGSKVLFGSDRSGSENLYTVRPDGTDLRVVTAQSNEEFLSPVWSPDGNHIVVLGSSLWLYEVKSGFRTSLAQPWSASGSRPIGVSGSARSPAFGPTSRYLYFSTLPGAATIESRNNFEWKIDRYDFETGLQELFAWAPGGAVSPVLSRDGRWLVFGTRHDGGTSFKLLDLKSGEDRWLTHGVQDADQERFQRADLMPGYAITPDNKAVIAAHHGKIWRIEIPSGKSTMIPFSADVDVELGESIRFDYPINDSVLTVTQIRDPRLSPDNKRVAFTALDHLYVMDLPNGTPKRLTKASHREHRPNWSPDGKWIVYVSWDDQTGAIHRVRSDGSGSDERLTQRPGYYRDVGYDPTGTRIMALRSNEPYWKRHHPSSSVTEVVWIPATGGDPTSVATLTDYYRAVTVVPAFIGGDTSRIYIQAESFRWDGTDRRQHLFDGRGIFSPNGKRFFIVERTANGSGTLFLGTVPLARHVSTPLAPPGAPHLGRQVSAVDADFPAWSADGTKLTWAVGKTLFIYDVRRGDSAVADSVQRTTRAGTAVSAGARPAYEAERYEIKITLPKDRPTGVIALRNARIITMRGDEVLETGDLVITNNRITAVGAAGTVTIPRNAKVLDLAGKTIMPGMVDVHAHPRSEPDIHALQVWDYAAALGYGVTTIRDPQSGLMDVFTYQQLVESGEMMGPRIYSTGPGIGGSDGDYSTVENARKVLRRYSEHFFTGTVKQYLIGNRRARQNFLMAARELGLTPTIEGGGDFKVQVTNAIDGYAGNEHTNPAVPLYRDVVQVMAQSGITYTPTLVVSGNGGPEGIEYMYAKHQDMHGDRKLRRFVPHYQLDRRLLRQGRWFADSEHDFQRLAEPLAKIVRANGKVALGGHGELPGIGEHWELWMMQSGGMTPHETLKCATLYGAESIGLGKDLGSLEVGKLADLIVLDKNPLTDIENSLTILFVMKNGRLYQGDTLGEVWPRQRPMPPAWWTQDQAAQ